MVGSARASSKRTVGLRRTESDRAWKTMFGDINVGVREGETGATRFRGRVGHARH